MIGVLTIFADLAAFVVFGILADCVVGVGWLLSITLAIFNTAFPCMVDV